MKQIAQARVKTDIVDPGADAGSQYDPGSVGAGGARARAAVLVVAEASFSGDAHADSEPDAQRSAPSSSKPCPGETLQREEYQVAT